MADKLLLEDGTSKFLLEDGTSFILLESADVGFYSPVLFGVGGIAANTSGGSPAFPLPMRAPRFNTLLRM